MRREFAAREGTPPGDRGQHRWASQERWGLGSALACMGTSSILLQSCWTVWVFQPRGRLPAGVAACLAGSPVLRVLRYSLSSWPFY